MNGSGSDDSRDDSSDSLDATDNLTTASHVDKDGTRPACRYTCNSAGSIGKVRLEDKDLQLAYHHFFAAATKEAELFNSKESLDKISIKKGDIRFSKSRILEGQ